MRLTNSAIAAVVLAAYSSTSSGDRPSASRELVAGVEGAGQSSASRAGRKSCAPRSGNRGRIFGGIFREGDKPGKMASPQSTRKLGRGFGCLSAHRPLT